MGRRPNPLILQYFARGPKLNDNSNRYPHTCRQCGENFPKGRIDSLTAHITKKCPALPDAERLRVCLELHGLKHQSALAAQERNNSTEIRQNALAATALSSLPQGWSGLETLAEASRQVHLNEHGRINTVEAEPVTAHPQAEASVSTEQPLSEDMDLVGESDQYNVDPGQEQHDWQHSQEHESEKEAFPSPTPHSTNPEPDKASLNVPIAQDLTPEERLQALLPTATSNTDASNVSVAVAATARLNHHLLDPQLVGPDTPIEQPAEDAKMTEQASEVMDGGMTPAAAHEQDQSNPQLWGEMTFFSSNPTVPSASGSAPPKPLTRGGDRMDTSDSLFNGRPKHARARFNETRRKEVQEIRKIGACIRCRILRKTCGKGTPCDTCKRVLAPRVWREGCVRTRLNQQLDLYSAGVQVVLSQNRINHIKETTSMVYNGTTIEVSHFHDSGHSATFDVLVTSGVAETKDDTESIKAERPADADSSERSYPQTMMIHQDVENSPAKLDKYTRAVFPLFVEKEPSHFVRHTLQTAIDREPEDSQGLLSKALELWGLVESIDRERQWTILERPPVKSNDEEGPNQQEFKWITETSRPEDVDVYGMICMQLNAAAERKANKTSRSLLALMDRLLTDSKIHVGFNMFLTAVIFLNCIEKSTWAFKAWEQHHLRPGWPLEREPSVFTQQGGNLAGLLRLLLAIRRALPLTGRDAQGKLVCYDPDAQFVKYFQDLDLDFDTVETRQKGSQFNPADSRSLELTFCSHLLLPTPPQG